MRRSCRGAVLFIGLLCTLGARHAAGGHNVDFRSSISHQVRFERQPKVLPECELGPKAKAGQVVW